MILIDTNVLVRSAQPALTHFLAAKKAVKTARLRGYTPCIVPQVIYEYWVVATRPVADNGLGMTTTDAEADVEEIIKQFQFFRDERAIFDRWHQLVAQYQVIGKTAHDARLVAAMNCHGMTHLVTFNDRHFQQFSHITVIHPDKIDNLRPAQEMRP